MSKDEMNRAISELRGFTCPNHACDQCPELHEDPMLYGKEWPDWSSDEMWPSLLREMLSEKVDVAFQWTCDTRIALVVYDGKSSSEFDLNAPTEGEAVAAAWLEWKRSEQGV